MNLGLFHAVLGGLLVLRFAGQLWARGPSPPPSWSGRLSVWSWGLIWVVLLAGALLRIQRDQLVPIGAAIVVLGALALRGAGLVALRGHYHEGIAVTERHELVDGGVYRWLRHPLHLALLGEMCGFALAWASAWALPLIAAALLVALHRNLLEERILSESLGEPYRRYLAGPAWDLVDLLPRRLRGESAA